MNFGPSSVVLEGKRALITGAAGGIGRASAVLLAGAGARVALTDIDSEHLRKTAAMIIAGGGEAEARKADVSRPDEIAAMTDWAADILGGLDIIVSNAGIQRIGLVEDFSLEDWDELMAVNARSCFLGIRYGIRHLRASGGGAIVNVASLDGLKGGRGNVAYSASKAAVIGLTRAAATELAPAGIRVNCVCPGWIDNDFNEPAIRFLGGKEQQKAIVESSVPLRRQGTNQEVAHAVVYLASDASSYVTGQALVIDGGVL
jgi:dihydroanticapsin dehydrogenase